MVAVLVPIEVGTNVTAKLVVPVVAARFPDGGEVMVKSAAFAPVSTGVATFSVPVPVLWIIKVRVKAEPKSVWLPVDVTVVPSLMLLPLPVTFISAVGTVTVVYPETTPPGAIKLDVEVSSSNPKLFMDPEWLFPEASVTEEIRVFAPEAVPWLK